MVRWYHAIFTAYGFWLPNDPRGSWSDFVASWELYRFGGKATTMDARRSVAHVQHDSQRRIGAKASLKFDPVHFNSIQRNSIACGIDQACRDNGIALHACAIGYDHVHMIVARHDRTAEDAVRRFKSWTTKQMNRDGCHPMAAPMPEGALHTPWAEGCWKGFIDDERQLRTAVDYVNRHPEKEGLPTQDWPFVTRI
jgi:REP element-mobilizing transposase RayT